ncbi:MAG: SRPBCC family protein [Sediminibacterium sp.]
MQTVGKTALTVEAVVNAPVENVWNSWTDPAHITQWAFASDDWHAPYADNDVRVGGKFKTTMAAKDGSVSFDFSGVYTNVEPNKTINYTMDDGRKAWISFSEVGEQTKVVETFEAEDTNSLEMQQGGWQMILNNFKKHTESL